MDDVRAVLKKLDAQGISYVGTPEDVWDEFKHLNNADDLEEQMMLAHAMFERLNEAWEGESAATRRMASRFKGGKINIEPLSDEEQAASTEAYYELFNFLGNSKLPGSKPSEKLQYALRWIAKFEQGGAAPQTGASSEAGLPPAVDAEINSETEQVLRQRGDGSYYYSSDEEERYK
jgi:hypothetical protein